MGSWKEFDGEVLPDDAIIVCRDSIGLPILLARVHHDDGLYPGMVIANDISRAFFAFNNQVLESDCYDIYTGDIIWKHCNSGFRGIPVSAVVAGYTGQRNPVFAVLGKHGESSWYPGWINPDSEQASVIIDGIFRNTADYKVLINKTVTLSDEGRTAKTVTTETASKTKKQSS